MGKRAYVVKCGGACPEILERISEELAGSFTARVEGGILRISFDEGLTDSREALELLREILSSAGLGGSAPRGVTRMSARQIQRLSGLPVNLEALATALRLRGRRAEAGKGYLETDADPEEVVELSSRIARCAEEMPKDLLAPVARRVVASACAHHEVGAGHLVEILKDRGILSRDPEGRLALSRPLEEVLEVLRNL